MREVFTGKEDLRCWVGATVKNGEARVDFEYVCEDFIPNGGSITYSYTFDRENTAKLIALFEEKYEGSLEEMLVAAEEKDDELCSFEKVCPANNIVYTRKEYIVV